MLIFKLLNQANEDEIVSIFKSVFTASEGDKEGKLIGKLASELSSAIDNQDVICIGTYQDGILIGSIFLTRLVFSDNIQIYMLAPVAVSTKHQGKGVGKKLIAYGLNELRRRNVKVVITYGDPMFYSKIGFQPLSESIIQAPMKLSMPEGWLGQSLAEEIIPTIHERPTCVEAFNNPAYW